MVSSIVDEEHRQEAQAFLVDLEALCRKHGVQLYVGDDDGVLLLSLKDGKQVVHAGYIDDCLDFHKRGLAVAT